MSAFQRLPWDEPSGLRGYCPVRQESSALHSLVVLVHASWGHVGFNHACLTGVRAFRGKFTARMRHP